MPVPKATFITGVKSLHAAAPEVTLLIYEASVGLSNHYQVQVRRTWVEAQDEAQVHPAF